MQSEFINSGNIPEFTSGSINGEFYIFNKDKYIVYENNTYTINLIPPNFPDDEIYILDDNECVLDKEQIKHNNFDHNFTTYEKLNTSGWNIKAKINDMYDYTCIDSFEAEHFTYGKIIGDLPSNKIHVTSLDAFKHFTDNHPINIMDIK